MSLMTPLHEALFTTDVPRLKPGQTYQENREIFERRVVAKALVLMGYSEDHAAGLAKQFRGRPRERFRSAIKHGK